MDRSAHALPQGLRRLALAPEPFALGMNPVSAKMTGMPAWEFRLRESELWGLVAFLELLPSLSAASYRDPPNTADNLVRWLRMPQSLKPGTAMPDLGVSERDGRDMAAFLNELR